MTGHAAQDEEVGQKIDHVDRFQLPLDTFAASGAFLRALPRAGSVTSIGILAFGRGHDAEIEVREVGFY